jgi:uncharacterized protein YlxW (UPF0749 family)
MSIDYSFEIADDLLKIKAVGKDDDLEEVMNYGSSVIEAAVSNNSTKVLCDETELIYALRPTETFQLAEHISEKAPNIVRAALVCKHE